MGAGLALLLVALHASQLASGRQLQDAPHVAANAATSHLPAAAAATTLPATALAAEQDSADQPVLDSMAGTRVEMKIINGKEVDSGSFNFMTALFTNGRFFCGGALLTNDSVLTAAHCVVDTNLVYSPSSLSVWLLGRQFTVSHIYAHAGYSASTIPKDNKDLTFEGELHDIALIKLAEQAPPGAPTVALAAKDTQLTPGQRLQVSGWGTTESGQASTVLRYAEVDHLPAPNCPADYSDVICAGGTGENTCNGDSGGPLLLRNVTDGTAVLIGITSHGPDCLAGPHYAFGYYTNVSKYLPTIQSWLAGQDISWAPSLPPDPSPS